MVSIALEDKSIWVLFISNFNSKVLLNELNPIGVNPFDNFIFKNIS